MSGIAPIFADKYEEKTEKESCTSLFCTSFFTIFFPALVQPSPELTGRKFVCVDYIKWIACAAAFDLGLILFMLLTVKIVIYIFP